MNVFGWLSELARTELRHSVSPRLRFWHLLGGLAIFLLFLEILSGILLMVYYRPSPDEAYESVRYIMNDAQLGWLIRGIHKWGADLLILTLLAHLLRICFQQAYREREFNWAIGVLLLLLTGAFAFTGILLVWDQGAFWSIDVARNIIQRVPLFGGIILNFLWGGSELEAGALLRFYVFHVGLLPWFMIALVLAHLYFVSRQGLFSSGRAPVTTISRIYGDLLVDGLFPTLLIGGILLTLAVLCTPALGERADPLHFEAAKAPWYFLPAYGLLWLASASWGLLVLGLGMLGLFLVPLLGRSPRWIVQGLGLVVGAVLLFLGVLGYLQGGLR